MSGSALPSVGSVSVVLGCAASPAGAQSGAPAINASSSSLDPPPFASQSEISPPGGQPLQCSAKSSTRRRLATGLSLIAICSTCARPTESLSGIKTRSASLKYAVSSSRHLLLPFLLVLAPPALVV